VAWGHVPRDRRPCHLQGGALRHRRGGKLLKWSTSSIMLSFWYYGRRPCPSALAPRLCSSPRRRWRSTRWHDVCVRVPVYYRLQRFRGACRPRGPPGDDGHRTLAVRPGSSIDEMPDRRAPHRRGGRRAAGNEALPGQARSAVWAVGVRLGSPGRTIGGQKGETG
jgi:hypothetical protein